jgi:hypothetical protein
MGSDQYADLEAEVDPRLVEAFVCPKILTGDNGTAVKGLSASTNVWRSKGHACDRVSKNDGNRWKDRHLSCVVFNQSMIAITIWVSMRPWLFSTVTHGRDHARLQQPYCRNNGITRPHPAPP